MVANLLIPAFVPAATPVRVHGMSIGEAEAAVDALRAEVLLWDERGMQAESIGDHDEAERCYRYAATSCTDADILQRDIDFATSGLI